MKFLFYISKSYSFSIITPIVNYLRTKPEHTIAFYLFYWTTDNFPDEWLGYEIFEIPEQAIEYNPDFVLAPGNFVDYRVPGLKVQLFHGLGVEKPSHFKIRPFFDIYCTSGPYVTQQYQRLQKKHHNSFLIRETGWSKIDYILSYPTENIRKKLNLPEDKKIILYAPTFSPKMQSSYDLLPVIPDMIRKDEYWLIKFHELMKKRISRIFQNYLTKNCTIIENEDITPYLHAADVLISDTSSVVYEFMALDKPVITFKTISRFDKGINIDQPDDLRIAIDRAIENPAEHKHNRTIHLNEINPYKDSKTGERIISCLEEILEQKLKPSKKRHISFFRKMKVLKKTRL
ncbi:CDP-glycerol glycerophosphotransferase family protein [Candidatus Cloacimonadota bacterium]